MINRTKPIPDKVGYAQNTELIKDSQSVFTLDEVVIIKGNKSQEINSRIGTLKLQQFAKNNVSKALNMLPDVNLKNNRYALLSFLYAVRNGLYALCACRGIE